MKIVFVSNFLNHHQLPLCEAFINEGIDYKFIATEPLAEEQSKLMYEDMNNKYDFVVKTYESQEDYDYGMQLCFDADVTIIGSAPIEFVKQRIQAGKLTFIYSERLYKDKVKPYKLPLHFWRFMRKYYRKKNMYLLCSSAFTAADFAKSFTFLKRAYKWGYFTEIKKYDDANVLIESKKESSILWVGRLIDLKHPELALEMASRLIRDGYEFTLNIIGTGPIEDEIKTEISNRGLENHVMLLGAMTPQKVREYMEQSGIFLFTSDRHEGWGAVLNEAMNSACGVVASHIIGSVPFLISDGENGLIYKDGDVENLYTKVKFLLDNPKKRAEMGKLAYTTLYEQWNAENAANRLIKLSQEILNGNKSPAIYDSGVCSKAKKLRDGWYK